MQFSTREARERVAATVWMYLKSKASVPFLPADEETVNQSINSFADAVVLCGNVRSTDVEEQRRAFIENLNEWLSVADSVCNPYVVQYARELQEIVAVAWGCA